MTPGLGRAAGPNKQARRSLLLAVAVFLVVGLGCSSADLVRRPQGVMTPTRTAMPTFTNTPDVIAPLVVATTTLALSSASSLWSRARTPRIWCPR